MFTVSYFLPDIIGMWYLLVWNFTLEDMHTPGVSSGVEILAVNVVTSNSPSANHGTAGSIIFYGDSRFTSSFAIPISFSCSTLGMS